MLVRSISRSFINGFSNNLAEVFTSMRGSAIHKNHVPRSKVKVTIQGQKVKFCLSGAYLGRLLTDFQIINLAELFSSMRGSAIHKNQVPRSKVKVTIQGQKVKFCPFVNGCLSEHNFVRYA